MPDRMENHNGLSSYLFVFFYHFSGSPTLVFHKCRGATIVEHPKRELKFKIHKFVNAEQQASNVGGLPHLSRL
jgi:hypothetical protein